MLLIFVSGVGGWQLVSGLVWRLGLTPAVLCIWGSVVLRWVWAGVMPVFAPGRLGLVMDWGLGAVGGVNWRFSFFWRAVGSADLGVGRLSNSGLC